MSYPLPNNTSAKTSSITATLKAVLMISVGGLAFALNPGVLVGCGPRIEGYGGCPQYEPSKQAAREALDEMPTRYEVPHDGGILRIDIEWLEIEMVQHSPSSLFSTCHAYSPCDAFETIHVKPSMTMTWTPRDGTPEVIAQDIVFRDSSFFDYAVGISETEDEVSNFMRASDPDGYWLLHVSRVRPEAYEIELMVGWIAPGPSVLDPPGTPQAPCWIEIRDGKVNLFKPQDAPSR